MGVETEADRLFMINTTDFGTTATYTLVAGGVSSVVGIFDNEYFEADANTNVGFVSTQPRFVCTSASLPSTAGFNDTALINAITYKVRVVQSDGTGMTTLILEKQ